MIRFLLPATALLAAAPALAQTGQQGTTTPPTSAPVGAPAGAAPAGGGATVTVGAAVNDQSGQPVGTITQITADAVVIDTGTVKAGVPRAAVGPGPSGTIITTVTKAQLDAAASQGAAQLKAMLVPGTQVYGSAATTVLGTVKAADDQYVTVGTDKGDVRLPANAFAARDGKLITSLTADQFNAAVAQSLPAASSAGSTTDSAATTTTTETRTTSKSRRRR